MKTLSFWKKSFYSGLVFFWTIIVLSVGYAVWNSPYVMTTVGSGSGLTANGWNALVNNIDDLHTRLSNITFSGGKVGIGNTNPGTTLDVNGTIRATNGILSGNNDTGRVGMIYADGVRPVRQLCKVACWWPNSDDNHTIYWVWDRGWYGGDGTVIYVASWRAHIVPANLNIVQCLCQPNR